MSLLERSLCGAVMILVIVALRAVFIHRLPKKTFLALWGVALARLLVPYSVPSALSVYSLLDKLASPAKVAPLSAGVPAVQPAHLLAPGAGIAPSTPAASVASRAVPLYMGVWMAGALVCAAFFAITYLKCRREFREALPVDCDFARDWLKEHRLCRSIRLRQSDRISAPLTYGVLRPVILLPKRIDWDDETALAYVLAHEYVHIRRFDAVTKMALTAALCVHWFNPAVWAMVVLANRDLELSCDEAVIRSFGERAKSAYAMTLIRMEESRSGVMPLYNHFSRHAIEERMIAIMKTKKTSWAAAMAAVALVAGVAAAFATSGQAEADKNDPADTDQSTMSDYTAMSYTDPAEGITYYSMDAGDTWIPMTDEAFTTASDLDNVEWWTAEEYAAWLEQEKVDLQSIIGSRSWTPSKGWFTWSQEMVDETIAQYEQTLRDIQAGQKISKPTADGDAMIHFNYDSDAQTSVTDAQVAVDLKRQPAPELLAAYAAYGLTYDEEKEALFFNGKLVRGFWDGYDMENGIATIYEYLNEDGVVDIHTVRQATQNADGSIDPGGKLAGIEEYSQAEFDSRLMMAPRRTQEAVAVGSAGETGGTTFEERFSKYKDFGITYAEADGASGRGNVYLNGALVSRFTDVAPDGSAFSFTSAEKDGVVVYTQYDGHGDLIGVREVLPDAGDREANGR